MNIINFNQSDFEAIKQNYIQGMYNGVCDKDNFNYVSSFYFKKAKIGRFFSTQEDLKSLKYFLSESIENNYYQIIEKHFHKLDKLFLDIIFKYAENFVYDKKCGIYAKRMLNLMKIEQEALAQIVLLDNLPINFVSIKDIFVNRFTNIQQIECTDLLSDKYIKSQNFHINKKYFGKDFLSTLFKIIKTGAVKIEEVNIESFFEEKDVKNELQINFVKEVVFKITKNHSYFNAKEIKNTTLTKRNFSKIYSYFLSDTQKNNLFLLFLKENDIIAGTFKNTLYSKDVVNIMEQSRKYVMFESSKHLDNVIIKYESIEEFLNYYSLVLKNKNTYTNISVYVNPRKFSSKTKKLLIDSTQLMNLLPITNFRSKKDIGLLIKNKFIEPIQKLINLGISEKTIRGLYSKILNSKEYFEQHKNGFIFKEVRAHDIYITISVKLIKIIDLYEKENFKNIRVLNSLLLILSSINLDSDKSLVTFNKVLEYMKTYMELLNSIENKPIKNLQELYVLISEEEEKKSKYIINTLMDNRLLSEKTIEFSKNIDCLSNCLKLLLNITESKILYKKYLEDNFLKGKIINKHSDYTVEINSHNDEIGVLGANVPGVCISPYGSSRMEQLNKNFLNLIVYDKDNKLMLWGLLCRLENNEGESIYILNNLQGSVNKKNIDTKNISSDIILVLKKLIKELNLKNVLTKDLGFNALKIINNNNLETINPFSLGYNLCKKTRLDFIVDSNFYQIGEK